MRQVRMRYFERDQLHERCSSIVIAPNKVGERVEWIAARAEKWAKELMLIDQEIIYEVMIVENP